MKFDSFEIVKEFPSFLKGRHSFRLYRSRFSPLETDKPIESYRYHFGFPKFLVEPIHKVLETTLYWGDAHWIEDGDFWVWHTFITSNIGDKVPYDALNQEVAILISQYNTCLAWYRRSVQMGADVTN